MSRYANCCPPEYLDEEDFVDCGDYSQQSSRHHQNDQNQNFSTSELQKQNTGIKIIPQLGHAAGLNKTDFDTQLDENAQKWFDQIHQYWRQFKKSPVLSNFIQQFYHSSPNPFIQALKFFANANDHPNPKANSFAYTILEELARFKRSLAISPIHQLDDNLKMVAFNFLKKCGQITAFKLVVETFELMKSKEMFVPEIRELIKDKLFKEAGQIACDLQLYKEFTIDDFLIPLILEDKLGIFEDYLDKAEHLRSTTIQLLDSFLHRDASVRQMCSVYIAKYDLVDVKYDKLHKKPVSKLISRLMKKYHLPESIAPNMKKHKEFGSLHFILRKNYVERSLNQASFEEMVKDTIGADNRDLQCELVHTCMGYGNIEDAVRWTKFYNVDLNEVPSLVRDKINGVISDRGVESGWSDDDWDDPSPAESKSQQEEIHCISIDPSHIILVNTLPSYRIMIADLRETRMIAFDTEWKPTILACNEVSLIQLATRLNVYLVDVISLIQLPLSDDNWSLLGRWIFNNDEILKVGFAHTTDIAMLMKFAPLGIQSSQQSSHSYLDLQGLWQKVANFPDFRFPFHEDLPSHSLSNLVKLCFGKKLDKSNQFSNWQQRPLRKEQISYAALDAYCLFEIYDVIGNVITGMGINYDELIDNILIENKKQIASMTKKESRNQKLLEVVEEPFVERKPINVCQIKFVTDYMLGSIGRILRQVGIDTVILKGDFVDHDECIKYSQREDRVVLTASKQLMVNRYQKHVKLGNTYLVNKYFNEIEGLEEIVKHFKINLKRHHVFSRCMVCNCDEFLVASKLQMIKLKYENAIPDDIVGFLKDPQKYSQIEFPEYKVLWKWTRYSGGNLTNYGAKIEATMADGTLKSFQTFYICEKCAKIYWDGGHYHNNCGGKLDFLFNLFPEAKEVEKMTYKK